MYRDGDYTNAGLNPKSFQFISRKPSYFTPENPNICMLFSVISQVKRSLVDTQSNPPFAYFDTGSQSALLVKKL
ncbi:hypothetical protein KSF78_0003325 [Schistosoma japonicum]|nr:hypothetical protein KSF78_0003325 [Schistosoma japonicum]